MQKVRSYSAIVPEKPGHLRTNLAASSPGVLQADLLTKRVNELKGLHIRELKQGDHLSRVGKRH
jgi:hypothetical protein